MAKATYKGTVVAESAETVMVEGNHYFPPDSVRREHLRDNATTTLCPWKGTARYYDVVVGDDVVPGAAWTYPEPKEKARHIKDHVAFWRGVEVEA